MIFRDLKGFLTFIDDIKNRIKRHTKSLKLWVLKYCILNEKRIVVNKKEPRKIEQIVDKKGIVYDAKHAINIFRPLTSEFHNSRMGDDEFRCNCCGMPVMFTSNRKTRYIKHKPMKEKR